MKCNIINSLNVTPVFQGRNDVDSSKTKSNSFYNQGSQRTSYFEKRYNEYGQQLFDTQGYIRYGAKEPDITKKWTYYENGRLRSETIEHGMQHMNYKITRYSINGELESIYKYDGWQNIKEIVENGIKKIFKDGKLIKRSKY